MGKLFWILIGLLGFALIALIINHDSGSVLGIENQTFATFAFTSAWVVLIGAAVLNRGQKLSDVLRQLVIWVAIFLGIMSVYIFRFDLQDIGSKLTGGLIPGSPISAISASGRHQVTLIRSPNGHFEADGFINQSPVRFLVDTGASNVVLTMSDARNAGIDPDRLNFSVQTQTANGRGTAARARLNELRIGEIVRNNIGVLVVRDRQLRISLLGQDFLESLHGYEKRGDQLRLTD